MEEKDARIKTRLDQLQDQVVELQKLSSPGVSPKASSAVSPSGWSSPTIGPSYLVIVGGWKEGERRDYVEANLSKLFAAAGVTESIFELQWYGKRPRCARVHLNFDWDEAVYKRELQQSVITKLRAQQWVPRDCPKPVWITPDRPPAQRAINRAIAIMGNFLQETLKVPRDQFEIDNWQAGRTYLGDHRISGTFPGLSPTRPPRDDKLVVWPVQDRDHGVSVWLDLHAVASSLNMDPQKVAELWHPKVATQNAQ